ncbi:MAG TPA: hypothetical protein VFW15_10335, partial [Thermoanaerobaculia bacterium]|nr:hypothetical protein [Thermoanaerobaculia bacterium]
MGEDRGERRQEQRSEARREGTAAGAGSQSLSPRLFRPPPHDLVEGDHGGGERDRQDRHREKAVGPS